MLSAGQLEWVNTDQDDVKPYNFDYWAVDGNLYDRESRCTFALFSNNLPAGFGTQGKWSKDKCDSKNSFICKVRGSKYNKNQTDKNEI